LLAISSWSFANHTIVCQRKRSIIMPVLEATGNREIAPNYVSSIAPKSVLRHRPIDGSTTPPVVEQRRASRSRSHTTAINDVPAWTYVAKGQKHLPLKLTKRPAAPRRTKAASRHAMQQFKDLSKLRKNKHWGAFHAHPLLYLSTGMLSMLLLWVIVTSLYGWCVTTLDDLKYGRPRTFQVDQVVASTDSAAHPTHFIVLNLNRHIEIIEMLGDNPAKTHIYVGPQLYGSNDDLTPVTLRFTTLPGKKYPNMLVQFNNVQVLYLNEGNGEFVPQ
jgi:hypothetical protein